jgi:hypothetical protein
MGNGLRIPPVLPARVTGEALFDKAFQETHKRIDILSSK